MRRYKNNIPLHIPLFLHPRLMPRRSPSRPHTSILVIANHMLYHVPNRPLAFAEIHRVLKPGGNLLLPPMA